MLFRFFNITRGFQSLVNVSKHNTMNQSKCYFRHTQKDDKVDICFLLKVKDSVRQFNLSRQATENVHTLCTRIATNVNKVLNKKSKKKNSDNETVSVQICDEKKLPVPHETSCSNLFDYKVPLMLEISESYYDIIFNAPWILNFNLPKSILVGFPVYPENLEFLYTEKHLSHYNWYRGQVTNEKGNNISEIHVKWEFIENGFYYTPTADDVGMKLKLECIPVNHSMTGPAVEEISKNVVEAGPGHCPFETRHKFTSSKLKDRSFRCVSYNILADLYCDSEVTRTVLHPYCPPYALHIDYRKNLIIKEILGYNADIMCLQEVDKKIFQHCLQPVMEINGLEGSFYKKGKAVSEGLTCFYRRDRFCFLEDCKILLSDALQKLKVLKPMWNKLKDNKPLTERLLDRSTVASATVLQSQDDANEVLIVGNTHLYFHPDADHIRLIQGGIVIYWLEYLKENLMKRMPNKRVSLILCGDFNSVPSCGIYQLYTTGMAPDTLPDWQSNANEAVKHLSLTQDIQLDSACGTPDFTNFTAGFADCLDYIFYEKSNLTVEQVVPFPSKEELTTHTALPSIVFPSDHIAVISDLQFK